MGCFKRIWKFIQLLLKTKHQAIIIPPNNHNIKLKQISKHALSVVQCLENAGYLAFLVGGGVRDLLISRLPKDFDIATNAHPEEIRALFKNSRVIGRRFRLVHIYFKEEIIEVSTFRASIKQGHNLSHTDNQFGSLEEDAWRRDFTVNALYFSIKDKQILDFTYGMEDISKRCIRVIGDPLQRFHEDPVRILRAIRLSAKLNFSIEKKAEECIVKLSHLLTEVSRSRLFDEVLKLFFAGYAQQTYEKLCDYDCFETLFPLSYQSLNSTQLEWNASRMIERAMHATDYRIRKNLGVNPGFLLAVLLWPALATRLLRLTNQPQHQRFVIRRIIDQLIQEQNQSVLIPKRLTRMIKEVWFLQYHMENLRSKKIFRIASHRYFRAAVDFLELRVMAGEPWSYQAQWWRKFREANKEEQLLMKDKLHLTPKKHKKKSS